MLIESSQAAQTGQIEIVVLDIERLNKILNGVKHLLISSFSN